MRLFSRIINKVLSSAVSVALVATSFPLTATRALAAPACASAIAADAGQDATCAAARIGGQLVAFPKMKWERVADMPLAAELGTSRVTGGSEAIQLANRSAEVLGLSPSDVASVVTLFPANVPYIYARYNPVDKTMRIDVFKLEKTLANGERRAGLYVSAFTPEHGNFWKASRSYIHPEAFKAGLTPGVNPFEAFKGDDTNVFHNISLSGAQVAIGHAMRYAGAPVAVMQVAQPRFSQEVRKSGNAFRKKVTTIINGHAKPLWLIAQPAQFMTQTAAMPQAAFCAPDPQRQDCAVFETATSGVSFEEFDGGMLSSAEDKWELERHTKTGWGFLAILIVAVIGSFALAALAPSLGLGAGVGTAAASGPAMGMFGNFLVGQGIITGFSSVAAAIAVEAAYIAATMLIAGANLSSVLTLSPLTLLGIVQVAKGFEEPPTLDKYGNLLNAQLTPRTTGNFGTGGPTLTGFRETVLGDCNPDVPLAQCSGASGMIQRVDQYDEHDMVELLRDNNGHIVRDASRPLR